MKAFARIPSELPRSGIREIMDLAWATEGAIHLEVGQPDFDTPDHIVEAACRGAREGHTRYVPNAGIDDLRAAAARYIERGTGVATAPEQILVTQGAVLSAATAFLGLLEPGDEVLLPDPGWPNYAMAVSLFHGRPVCYNLRPERSFLPDIDEMESLVSDRTRLLLLCNPSNPTGQVHDRSLTGQLMEFARRHDLWVLSDEIYGEIVFDGDHASALPHDADERLILVTGMSKSFAMTGFRVGLHPGAVATTSSWPPSCRSPWSRAASGSRRRPRSPPSRGRVIACAPCAASTGRGGTSPWGSCGSTASTATRREGPSTCSSTSPPPASIRTRSPCG